MIKKLLLLILFFGLASLVPAQEKKYNEFQTKEIRDIVYKKIDGEEIRLNLFLPVRNGEQVKNVPLLIFIDSGCWYSKGPGNGGLWRSWRAVEKGNAVASVAHRNLGAGHVFPTQIEDVKAAVRYLRAHAEEYGLDKNRFAVLGLSSGGHLASMLGLSDKHRLFDVGDNLDQSSQVQRVINFFSTSDISMMMKTSPTQAVDCVYLVLGAKKIPGHKLCEQAPDFIESSKKYSPIIYVDKDFAPTLTLQGLKDTTVLASQSCLFYEALLRAGVRTDIYIGNQGKHSWQSIASSEELEKMVFDFLQF